MSAAQRRNSYSRTRGYATKLLGFSGKHRPGISNIQYGEAPHALPARQQQPDVQHHLHLQRRRLRDDRPVHGGNTALHRPPAGAAVFFLAARGAVSRPSSHRARRPRVCQAVLGRAVMQNRLAKLGGTLVWGFFASGLQRPPSARAAWVTRMSAHAFLGVGMVCSALCCVVRALPGPSEAGGAERRAARGARRAARGARGARGGALREWRARARGRWSATARMASSCSWPWPSAASSTA